MRINRHCRTMICVMSFYAVLMSSDAPAVEWNIETVDSVSSVGSHTDLVLDGEGNPHISYYDETNRDLKYAFFDGDAWQVETVDSVNMTGQYTSLVLDRSGNPRISYSDATISALL